MDREDLLRSALRRSGGGEDIAVEIPRERVEYEIISGDVSTDRKSRFQAHLARVSSEADALGVVEQLKEDKKIRAATHNIVVYRIRRSDGSLVRCVRRLPEVLRSVLSVLISISLNQEMTMEKGAPGISCCCWWIA